ncbi:hypothetical protein QQ045_010379 [Rhodiola kirilowii]
MACVTTAKFSVLINGKLEDFFSSNRGLRQGDPLSPFLFTLIMDVFSRRLNNLKYETGFGFHPKCSRPNINHLMFADDVLILAKASASSLACIKSALEDFYAWSGLKVNEDKSCIFFGAHNNSGDEGTLVDSITYKIGKLSFNYLGIPLDSKSLKPRKCNGIIDKMTRKIKGWSARKLSYADRLVLIKHILQSICSFWTRMLIFPGFVMKKVIMICRNYLWSGSCVGSRSLVAWENVCKPKSNGGLDLKNPVNFNKALALSQICDLCLKKDSLWIKWMNNYFFKNRSYWELEEKNNHSWVLKKKIITHGCSNVYTVE